LALVRQTTALVVVQPQRLAFHLLLEDAVLLTQILDHFRLLAADPAGECE
jgi:hypothetical protein